jgi:hypothetical protein
LRPRKAFYGHLALLATKGIIDIKPSNILVKQMEGEAVPKVIDFGLAKALGLLELRVSR